MPGILYYGLAVIDEKINELRGDAGNKNTIKTGELEIRAEMAAAVGIAPAAGKRRLAYGCPAAAEGGRRAGKRPGHQAERIIGTQRVGPGWLAIIENLGPDAVPPDEIPVEAFPGGFLFYFTCGQVDKQQPAH